MVRIVRDEEIRSVLPLARIVAHLEDGYRADARGDVVPFPRQRIEARGTTLAFLGAALPSEDLLGFRSYLYNADGIDRGHQVVALYGAKAGELRALFVGRLVGNLRTGASIAAALHLVEPVLADVGLLGTGYQARNALVCLRAVFPRLHLIAWSPSAAHRTAFQRWASSALGADVELARDAGEVVRRARAVVLTTSAESPVLTPETAPEPRLLLSLSAYRRPELAPALLDRAPRVWTDSVAQASAPGTLFESAERRRKLRPLAEGLDDGRLRDGRQTRIILNTGAAWEEVVVAEALLELAIASGIGTDLELRAGRDEPTVF